MLILVTGSRTWDDADYIRRILDEEYRTSLGIVLHHGSASRGADSIADRWAIQRLREGRSIQVVRHPAKWRDAEGNLDRRAGYRRNAEMVEAVLAAGGPVKCRAFIRDRSSGATHCANVAAKAGIATFRHRWEARDVSGA